MDGMFLSDSEQQPTKWQFPYITLEPNAQIIVFASGRDIKQPWSTSTYQLSYFSKGDGAVVNHTGSAYFGPHKTC